MSTFDSLLLDPFREPKEIWIAWRTDGASGSGAESDPYDGSTAAKFDAIMAALAENATVHIGPGVFETRGSLGWQPKAGQRILGSGIDVTTFKLVNLTGPGAKFIDTAWNVPVPGLEAADFTIDCNLAGQGTGFPVMVCGGIGARGDHVRIRRVRIINFGTQNANQECFPLDIGSSDPQHLTADAVIEDCIVEQPSLNNVRETSCIVIFSSENANGPAFHRGCVIRNCLVDCEYKDRPVRITGIAVNTTTHVATVTTATKHGRNDNDWVIISGAMEGPDPSNTTYNGSYQISVANDYEFTYTPYDSTEHPRPSASATGEMWLGKWPSHHVQIDPNHLVGVQKSGGGSSWTVTITTTTPHFRVPANNVAVGGVVPSGYNGVFAITSVLNPFQLIYTLTTDPGDCVSTSSGRIGVNFQGLTGDGGTAVVVEGNRVIGCVFGHYHDTWSTKDLTIRNNHFRSVIFGVYTNFDSGGAVGPQGNLASITYVPQGDQFVATAHVASGAKHYLTTGDAVHVQDATFPQYNGNFTVTGVPADDQFQYALPSEPFGSSAACTFNRFWQAGRLLIEDNVIDLMPMITNYGPPYAILLGYAPGGLPEEPALFTEPPRFRQVVIRGNVIRHVDGASDRNMYYPGKGIVVAACRELVIDNNVVDLDADTPIVWYKCRTVKCLNNRTSSGTLLLGFEANNKTDWRTWTRAGELATDVEDALLLGL